jgi:hypothetical protein
MPTAIVTINGRRARLTGESREAILAKINELSGGSEVSDNTIPKSTTTQGFSQDAIENKQQENQEPKQKAGLLDLLSLAGTSNATQSGRNLAEYGSGMLGNIPKAIPQVKGSLTPQNPGEKVSLALSNIGGAISPQSVINMGGAKIASGVGKALGGGVGAKIAGYGAAGAVENVAFMPERTDEYLQPNKIAERAGVGAAFGVAIPASIGSVSAGTRLIGSQLKKLPEKIISETIGKTPKKARKYNINPTRTILEEKMVTNDVLSLDGLSEKVSMRKKQLGEELESTYKNMSGTMNVQEDVLSPALKRIKELMQDPKQNASAIKGIEAYVIDNNNKNLSKLTPNEVWNIKKSISDRTKYSGGVADDEILNEVRQKAVRNITNKLNEINPTLKKLNTKYSDLHVAEEMISNTNANMQARNIFSPSAKAGGGLVAGLDAVAGGGFDIGSVFLGLSTAAGIKAMQTPAVKLRMANAINSSSIQNIAKGMEKSPTFASLFNKFYGTSAKTPADIKDISEKIIQSPKTFGLPEEFYARQGQKALPPPQGYTYTPKGEAKIIGKPYAPSNLTNKPLIADMTPEDWLKSRTTSTPKSKADVINEGLRIIRQRIKDGKEVNPAWLKKYPNLKKQGKKQ